MNMKIEKCIKSSFSVIGKEGSTKEGSGFVSKLWKDANNHFDEVDFLAKKDEKGNVLGVW
ncbi:transcriptional regulator, partial [Clostridium sulfidigenes]